MQKIHTSILAAFGITTALTSHASGETSPWEVTAAAGVSFSDGNSDSLSLSLQLLASYYANGNEIYLGADYFYSEQGDLASSDSLRLFGQYNRDLTDRFYVGGYGSYLQDNVADIDYRVDAAALFGYRVLNDDRMKLSLEAGPGYAWEKQSGHSDSFATIRFAQRFEYQFSKYSKFWQSIGWTPSVDDLSDSIFDLELGVETRLTDRVALRTFFRNRIDTTPAAGRGRSDSALMLGVSYDLGGLPEPATASGGRRSLMPAEDAAPEKKTGWISTAALGFGLNKGNSDKAALNLAWNTAYLTDEREFFFDLGYVYGEDDGQTSTDRLSSRVQYNRYLSDLFYIGGGVGFLHDGQADLDYRITPAALAGYALIKTDATKLVIEGGPAWTFEKSGGASSDYFSLTAAQRLSHQFTKRLSANQAVVWTAETSDLQNYNLIASASLDAKMTESLIWRVGVDYTFDNTPAAGREHHDTLMSSSVAVKF